VDRTSKKLAAAWTSQKAPTLFWHVDELPAESTTFSLTLAGPSGTLEYALAPPSRSGVQRTELAELGIELAPDVVYVWYLAMIPDALERSRDRVATGYLAHVVAPEDHEMGIYELARKGYWYDALAATFEEGLPAREASALRKQLLAQGGVEVQLPN